MPDSSDIIQEAHILLAHPSEGRLEGTKADQLDDPAIGQWETPPTPKQKGELKAWREARRWHPHHLRHNAAEIRRGPRSDP
jgi:hypothetical protein